MIKIIKTINEKFIHDGVYLIRKVKTLTGKIIETKIINNTITNVALNEIIKPLVNISPDMQIKELSIGTGSTTPSGANTTLETEVYRISSTDQNITDTGQVTTEFILNGTEYAGAINEIGIFAGTSALAWGGGAGKDTGLLISRVLWSTTIAIDESIYFQRIDTFT